MNFASLFAGIGGFDLGFERAGMHCIHQVEMNSQCQSVLRRHFNDCTLTEDVTSHETINTLRDCQPDLICGGFPCQDLSVAGRRHGLAGERSGLWYAFRDVLDAVRPRWVCVENVDGLRSSNKGRDLGIILHQLGELGYWWAYRVFDSQYLGVAQRRRRVFIVGHLGERGRSLPTQVLFEPESVYGNPPSRGEAGTDVAACVRGGIESGSNEANLKVACCLRSGLGTGATDRSRGTPLVPETAWCLQERDAKGPDSDTKDGHLIPYTIHGTDKTAKVASETHVAGSLRTRAPGSQENSSTTVVSFAQNQRGELRESPISPSLSIGGGKPGEGYPAVRTGLAVRRLTPRECERLQAFPETIQQLEVEICLDHRRNCVLAGIRSHRWRESAYRADCGKLLLPAKYVTKNLHTNHPARERLAQSDVHIYFGRETVEISRESGQSSSANGVGRKSQYPQLTNQDDFARLIASTFSTVDQITRSGEVESPQKDPYSTHPVNGNEFVVEFGGETTQRVKGALRNSSTTGDQLTKFITSPRLKSFRLEQNLQISFCSVLDAITGFIPERTKTGCSLRILLTFQFDWTRWADDGTEISNSARYRMLGNAVTVNVARWIGCRILKVTV